MSNTPIIINNETSKCPKCKHSECIIEVCKHCGHEYKDLDNKPSYTIKIIFIWIIVTLILWLTDYNNATLFEIIQSQWVFLKSLRIY